MKSSPSTWWGRALTVLPIRPRAAVLLPIILCLGFVPFIVATWECFWNCGFSDFYDELEDCYASWGKAVKAIWLALITGDQQ